MEHMAMWTLKPRDCENAAGKLDDRHRSSDQLRATGLPLPRPVGLLSDISGQPQACNQVPILRKLSLTRPYRSG